MRRIKELAVMAGCGARRGVAACLGKLRGEDRCVVCEVARGGEGKR